MGRCVSTRLLTIKGTDHTVLRFPVQVPLALNRRKQQNTSHQPVCLRRGFSYTPLPSLSVSDLHWWEWGKAAESLAHGG